MVNDKERATHLVFLLPIIALLFGALYLSFKVFRFDIDLTQPISAIGWDDQ